MALSKEIRNQVQKDYETGLTAVQIEVKHGVSRNTVATWAKRYKWDNAMHDQTKGAPGVTTTAIKKTPELIEQEELLLKEWNEISKGIKKDLNDSNQNINETNKKLSDLLSRCFTILQGSDLQDSETLLNVLSKLSKVYFDGEKLAIQSANSLRLNFSSEVEIAKQIKLESSRQKKAIKQTSEALLEGLEEE